MLVQHVTLVEPVGDAIGADKRPLAVLAEADVEIAALQVALRVTRHRRVPRPRPEALAPAILAKRVLDVIVLRE
jgi:hypothetical protein